MCNATRQINTTYNGWSNYETWLANLWLTSDEYNYFILTETLKSDDETFKKADRLKERLSWQLEEVDIANLWQDLLQCAFDRINWNEIVEKNLE